MIKIELTKKFKKQLLKLDNKIKTQFKNRLNLFISNPNDPLLNTHPLKGNLLGYYSFSVTGDIRVIFKWKNKNICIILIQIGTHSQLY